ncbi:MAG: hypothetical protein ACKKL5_01895 [Candidatus Komeilibacteria bacterium]
MILVNRFFTYFLPGFYWLSALLWLVHPAWVFASLAILLLLLLLYALLNRQDDGRDISIWLTLGRSLLLLLISVGILILLPQGWAYVGVATVWTGLFYLLLSDHWVRKHPFLQRRLWLTGNAAVLYTAWLFFSALVVVYNFILLLNWPLWQALLVMAILWWLLLLLAPEWLWSGIHWRWLPVHWFINLELVVVLYYLPADIYIKSFIITIHWLALAHYNRKKLLIVK